MSAGLRELHSNEAIRESYKTYKNKNQRRPDTSLRFSFHFFSYFLIVTDICLSGS
jgi:hypothetical protein